MSRSVRVLFAGALALLGAASGMLMAACGSSATTPPSRTANRSSEIVPSTTGRDAMKRRPAPNRRHMPSATAAGGTATTRMPASSADASTNPARHTG